MDEVLQTAIAMAKDFSVYIGLGVFVAYFLVDAMYAYYTLAVAHVRPVAAATSGSLIHFLLAFGVISYVDNYLYIVPIAVGSWFGTYFMLKLKIGIREVD